MAQPPTTDAGDGASGADRLTEPADAARQPRLPFPVVGVGASAGGLEAYTEFLRATPADTGMAFVLVQHLPPDRESLLVELLAKQTAMSVREVADGDPVEPNHVYVIRPGRTLTLADGRLHLGEPLAARGHGRPVDDFFRSLAAEQQQRAIAVVLSGMGSNGTAGAEAVEAVGGLVVAQDPESAKYPAMPRSLIDAGLADFVLRPAEMPEVLARYAAHPYVAAGPPAEVPRREEQALGEILGVLRTRTRHDFTGYRKPTLLRRIQRRMGLGHVATLGEYVKALRQSGTEVTALADDLLIHVTGFFRDPEAWAVLREKVIDPLADDRPDGSPVRAWVTACATGEEAYSLAMLLVEAAEARGKAFDIKVFATDLAERALGHARAGVFPGGIESEVSAERLERFFDPDDSLYRVKRELRELVIFAPQNVLQDPPFSRLDIVTCRNLLIYLEPDTQRRVLSLLHFGLREGGALLLGSSESAGAEDEFQPIDKKHRLFRRLGPTRHGSLDFPRTPARPTDPPAAGSGRAATQASVAQTAARMLLDSFTPAAVVVDGQGQIVYFHGDTGRYLDQPRGEPTRELLTLASEQVRGAVRTALHRVAELGHPVVVRDGLMDTRDGRRRVEVGAAPLDRRPAGTHVLVTFRDHPEQPPAAAAGDPSAEQRLVDELQRVRDELQSTLEEMQTSNEEMKASHEEVTSINEELQSTNEELETSKEELQSLNEELTTVNAQLQAKMAELEATGNDLASLLASTDIAVLFLDPRFRIRRFTPAVKDLLDLIPSDVGRPLSDLRRKFTDPNLPTDAQAVLDKLVPVEREVASESGRQYLRRVLPYRTQDNRIDGVVVAFLDVTEQRQVDAALRASEERLGALMRASGNAVYRMSPDWRQLLHLEGVGFLANTTRPSDSWLDQYIPPDDRPAVQAAVDVAVRAKTPFEMEHRVVRADGTVGWTHSRAVPLLDAAGEIAEWFGAASDVTPRVETRDALRQSEEKYRNLFGLIDEGFCIIEMLYDGGRPVDYRFLEVNPAFERQAGLADAGGRRVREVAPDHDAHWFEIYGRVADTGEPVRFQQTATALGRVYDVYAFRTGPPGQRRVAVLFTDITDRKREEERQAFRLKLSDTLRPVADPVEVQAIASRLLGEHLGVDRSAYTEAEPGGEEMVVAHDWTGPGTPSVVGRYRIDDFGPFFTTPLRQGRTAVMEDAAADPRLTPETAAAWAAIGVRAAVAYPLVKGGRLTAVLFVHVATPRRWTPAEVRLVEETAERTWAAVERAKAEAALRASEDRLRAVAANLPSGAAFVVGPDLRYQLAAGLALGPAGFDPADLEGKTVAETMPPEMAAEHEANYRRALAGERFQTEHTAHGRHYVTHGAPLRDAGGAVTAALAVSYDITDRVLAEDALRTSREQLRLALSAARMGIWQWDVGGDTHRRDANLSRLLGRPAEEYAGPLADFLACLHPDDRDRVAAAFESCVRHGHNLSLEFRTVWPDGTVRWLRDQGDVFGGPDPATRNLAGACVDVTDLKQTEAALRATRDTLEGRVAARTAELAATADALLAEIDRRRELTRRLGTAEEAERRRVSRDLHDTAGQLLAGLSLTTATLTRVPRLPPAAAGQVTELTRLTDELARELHALAVRLRPTALDDVGLEAALAELVRDWSARTGVAAEFQGDGLALGRLPAETETALYRVVQEALTNVARHAKASLVSVIVNRPDGHAVAVVEDDGVGFEPAAVGAGRLGLAGMRERVELAGGTLEVESAPGRGTTVLARVPVG